MKTIFFAKNFILQIAQNKFVFLSFFVLCCFFLVAVLADVIAPYSFSEIQPAFLQYPPVWMEKGVRHFILGTDDLGRDILSRLVYGARFSIGLGFMVVILSMLIGVPIGLFSGYCGGRLDKVVISFVDIMMSVPSILLAVIVVAILGPGLFNTVLAVNMMAWPAVIRIARAETLKEKNKDYILAEMSFGTGYFRILFYHILPNIAGPLIVQAILGFSEAILNTAALGFLGLGAKPPFPEWGTMISDGRDLMIDAWWMVVFPGFCILCVVLSLNILGAFLRDSLDRKF